ncbi:peptidase family M48-domain-containing protein [Melanogaster broomeanus]|nr:peptidase family M48-domain-containing protein [Melanogaster broomeanus]
MDLLHTQLAALQLRLSFVATDPIDWKFYVQACSWAVTLFESYLLCVISEFYRPDSPNSILWRGRLRQYPLYSKTEPPAVLARHFDKEAFRKSQLYGKDKAQFSLVTGLLKQAIDSAMLQYGFYAWAWGIGGGIIGPFGLWNLSFQIIMVIVYPTIIQPLFNKLSPLPAGDLRSRTETLATKLKFPLKHLYEIDGSKRSSHSNAYFFGLPWSKHIVIFDTLIKESKPDEVEAVLAHELGHWYYMHPTKHLCISQVHIFTILALFPAFLHAPQFIRAFDFSKAVSARPPTIVAFLMFQMILTPMEAVVSIAMNFLSRHFEWEADRFACELQDQLNAPEMSDMGERLGRALITLHVKNLSTVWVDWLYSAYHHSHPTLTERLKALEGFQAKRKGNVKKEL